MIKAAAGVSVDEARDAVAQVVRDFSNERGRFITPITLTWEQVHQQMLGAVENEKGMVTFLFAIIGLVAIVMVATTFYTLIQSKTRDIGILRAIGATRLSILGLFVGYGLAIGVVGAGLGAALAVLTVKGLNLLQYFLGNFLGVSALLLGSLILGALLGLVLAIVVGFRQRRMLHWLYRLPAMFAALFLIPCLVAVLSVSRYSAWLNENIRFVMWDPQTYFFDRIPDRINPWEMGVIVAAAIISSALGALIPALVASSLDPVETLRYE